MAEKLLLIWLRDTCGTEALLLLLAPGVEVLLLLLHAAAMRAALLATAVKATLFVTDFKETTSLWAGTCRGKPKRVRMTDPAPPIYLGKH
jgi:hypothetical protein